MVTFFINNIDALIVVSIWDDYSASRLSVNATCLNGYIFIFCKFVNDIGQED